MADPSYPLQLFTQQSIAENFICPICLNIPNSGKEHADCGSIFCNECIDSWNAKSNKCPSCNNNNLKESLRCIKTHSKKVYSMLQSLHMRCPSKVDKSSECEWTGEKLNAATHFSKCSQTLEHCKLGCGLMIKRKDIEIHENKECSNKLIECSFCKSFLPTNNISHHLSVCLLNPNREVSCRYANIGCAFKGILSGINVHEENKILHFDILLEYSKKMKAENLLLKKEADSKFFYTHCPANHPLNKLITHSSGLRCNVCGEYPVMEGDVDWQCSPCDWDCCARCFESKSKAVRCIKDKEHILSYTSYKKENGYDCHICKAKIFNSGRYWCVYCLVNVCMACYEKMN